MLNEKLLRIIEKCIPKKLYKMGQPIYHWLLALLAAIRYGFPSRKINIVAVTGTKGKTTTTEIVASILEAAGHRVALANGIRFKIGDTVRPNKYKMSMPGRFFTQRFIYNAVQDNCNWVVLEITSEGAKQFRHKWVDLNAFIFTNLSPEHIESHGSFEAYRAAKLSIGESLKKQSKETYMIANADDEASEYFFELGAQHNISFSTEPFRPFKTDHGIEFRYGNSTIYSKLHGIFNLKNILAALSFAEAIGLDEKAIKNGIESLEQVPGRVEQVIDTPFEVYVDYAHTPDSLLALYESFPNQKKVCVLGNTGGGRDTWKRPEMASIADKHCDHIILTNEDPYDEDPDAIVSAMRAAIKKTSTEIIMDRRNAINTALKKAKRGHVVLITGKGTDPYIMGPNGTKEPWSDAQVVREEFAMISKN